MYPVLLVHGVDDTSLRMEKMRTALQAQGFASAHAMDIVPPDASISFSRMGEQVRDNVKALQRQAGVQKLDIVAYSMGALAVRYFLHNLDGHRYIRRFIAVAAPHHGTLTAYFRQNIGSRQMRPGSAFLREMQAEEGAWGDVAVFSFWTPLDLMIVPATSSLLLRAQNRAFNIWLHPWMTSDRRVIEAVIQTLDAPDQ